jgi:hypothetical protein
MLVMGNLIWDSTGSVAALFRVREGSGGPAALLPALAVLSGPSKLSTVEGAEMGPAGGPRWVLSVEVRGSGMTMPARLVADAAGAAVLRPFGVARGCPSPRRAAAHRAAAGRLVAGLAAFRLGEMSAAEVRSALDAGGCGWREVRCCGYATSVRDGHTGYRACFVALPLKGVRAEWPLPVSDLPAAAWSVCVRPSRGGADVALLGRIVAADLVDLGERAAALRGAVGDRGWDLIRPGSGQALLGAAMVPGPGDRRLPRTVFVPLPQASPDSVSGLLPVS